MCAYISKAHMQSQGLDADIFCVYAKPMKPNPLRTTISVVRNEIGVTQQEFADLISKSRMTIQSLELGKLALSEKLALLISAKTGVSASWLLGNDPASPIVDMDGRPWTKESFEKRAGQAIESDGSFTVTIPYEQAPRSILYFHMLDLISNLWPTYLSAVRSGKREILEFRLSEFIKGAREAFGVDRRADEIKAEHKILNDPDITEVAKKGRPPKTAPSPPSRANAPTVGARKSSSPGRHRRDDRASEKP
jgi:transcriptional regulator with XRE-family HTH domain